MVNPLAGVDEYARLHAGSADFVNGAAHKARGVRMEGNVVRARVRQASHIVRRVGHHDMHIHDDLRIVLFQLLNQLDGHAEVGNIVAIHQVDVKHGRATGDKLIQFFLHMQEAAVDNRCGIEHGFLLRWL